MHELHRSTLLLLMIYTELSHSMQCTILYVIVRLWSWKVRFFALNLQWMKFWFSAVWKQWIFNKEKLKPSLFLKVIFT